MTIQTRIIVVLVFSVAFFAIAPFLLLSAAGFRVQWTNWRIVKTGSFHIETLPNRAKVFINGIQEKETTPMTKSRLFPGTYTVKIEKDNYHPWTKRLDIHSGQVTFITNTPLFSNEEASPIVTGNILHAAWGENILAYIEEKENGYELFIKRNKESPQLLARFAPSTYSATELSFSPKSDTLAVLLHKTQSTELFLYAPNQPQISTPIEHISFMKAVMTWGNDNKTILIKTPVDFFLLNKSQNYKKSTPLFLGAGVHDTIIVNDELFTVIEDRTKTALVLFSQKNDTHQHIIDLPMGQYHFLDQRDDILVVADKKSGILRIINKQNKTIIFETMGSSIAWEESGSRAIVWNSFEISIVNIFEKTRSVITRITGPIISAAWDNRKNAILFSTPDTLLAAELDIRDKGNVTTLITKRNFENFSLTGNKKIMQFFVKNEGVFEKKLFE